MNKICLKVKKIEDLTEEELLRRMDAIEPLCKWEQDFATRKTLFMQNLWGHLAYVYAVRIGELLSLLHPIIHE